MTRGDHSWIGMTMCAAVLSAAAFGPFLTARAQEASTESVVPEPVAASAPASAPAAVEADTIAAGATQPAVAGGEPASTPASQPVIAATGPASAPAGGPAVAEAGPTSGPTTQPGETETANRIVAPVPGQPLLLNFKDASVQAVLEYLSQAAGLIILDGDRVEGRVTVLSHTPVTTDEAVALLDTVLKDKGYAAVQAGRTLKIVSIEEAARQNLPVHAGGDPEEVPMTDRMVTQIIPIRYADATRLRTDLAPILGEGAKVIANQASNALIVVDTQINIRRIMTVIRKLDEQMATVNEVKIYQLKYADATATSTLITNLLKQDDAQSRSNQRSPFPFLRFGRGGRGSLGGGSNDTSGSPRQQRVVATADDRTNTLVVSAPSELLAVVDKIIEKLDSDPTDPQSVFIYPLKNAQAENLETVLNNIFSDTGTTTAGGRRTTGGRTRSSRFGARFGGSSRFSTPAVAAGTSDLVGQVYVVSDEDTNSLLVRTPTKHMERVKEILKELDRAVPQVLIKVLIAEVTHDGLTDLGTEFSVLNLGLQATASVDVNTRTGRVDGGLISATMTGGMASVFNALQRQGRIDVLSRPYILASDNQEATITVGQEVPRITNSRVTDTGQTINTVKYEDVGIILTVTPHVNPEGLVIMDVSPEISSVSESTVPITESANAQLINKRTASTQVAIHNGQTIVIGGLMEDRIDESVRKVPGLGDLPLLGPLFRKVNKTKVKTELLIFLTPRVAQAPDHLTGISQDETDAATGIREAGGNGAFDEHLKAMTGGKTHLMETEPATAPTTAPSGVVIELNRP